MEQRVLVCDSCKKDCGRAIGSRPVPPFRVQVMIWTGATSESIVGDDLDLCSKECVRQVLTDAITKVGD